MSDKKRLRRIERLLRVSEVRRDDAQAKLGRAQSAVEAAELVVERANELLADGATRILETRAAIVSDFADAYAYMRSLRLDVDQARALVREAEAVEQERRAAAVTAHREVRKMEMWGEATTQRVRLEEAKNEQVANDELAALLTNRREA